ncbi:SEC-C metal-binding domain-containing protein [Quatrionicoccus australiensis]
MTSDNTTKCPCGSGKKFRKCHRATIEQMLKYH